MRVSRLVLVGFVVLLVVAPGIRATARVSAAKRTFYLDLRAGQCATFPLGAKFLQVVPCSNAAHNLEAYYVGHGGWGHGAVPARAAVFAIARSRCTGIFQRRFGHPIRPGYGWYAFWPDRGKEQAKYGDRVICSLDRFPGTGRMGPGVHHG